MWPHWLCAPRVGFLRTAREQVLIPVIHRAHYPQLAVIPLRDEGVKVQERITTRCVEERRAHTGPVS
jgi:hypothetical protein